MLLNYFKNSLANARSMYKNTWRKHLIRLNFNDHHPKYYDYSIQALKGFLCQIYVQRTFKKKLQ